MGPSLPMRSWRRLLLGHVSDDDDDVYYWFELSSLLCVVLPLLSIQFAHHFLFDSSVFYINVFTTKKEFGGDEVVAAKAGAGSATLSMAYAGFIFTENVLKALRGEDVTQCAFVESDLTEAEFFASPVKFGKDGIEEILPLGELSAYEKGWYDKMMPELKKQIQKGVDFVNK
jgi:malate/lactate dehydrogenase